MMQPHIGLIVYAAILVLLTPGMIGLCYRTKLLPPCFTDGCVMGTALAFILCGTTALVWLLSTVII